MNTAVWMLAGAMVGWLGYSVLGFNQARGAIVSSVIGATGGVVGGKLVAPVFIVSAAPGDFSFPALLFAAAIAAAFLVIGNLLYTRWGV